MSLDQIAALNAVATILQLSGGWLVGSLALIIVGPWVALLCLSRGQEKRAASHDLSSVKMLATIKEDFTVITHEQEGRFESVVRMYENNVLLLKDHLKVSNNLLDALNMNTGVLTRLTEKIERLDKV